MFDSIGWGEMLVIAVAGLFILGPERLPDAAAWLGQTIKQVKAYAAGASAQIREELGPEFEELRRPVEEIQNMRGRSPRKMAVDALLRDTATTPREEYAAEDNTDPRR